MGGWSHENADKRLATRRTSHTITIDPLYRKSYEERALITQRELKAAFLARQAVKAMAAGDAPADVS